MLFKSVKLIPIFRNSKISLHLFHSESEYHKVADTFMNKLVDSLEDLGDKVDVPDYDVLYSVFFISNQIYLN